MNLERQELGGNTERFSFSSLLKRAKQSISNTLTSIKTRYYCSKIKRAAELALPVGAGLTCVAWDDAESVIEGQEIVDESDEESLSNNPDSENDEGFEGLEEEQGSDQEQSENNQYNGEFYPELDLDSLEVESIRSSSVFSVDFPVGELMTFGGILNWTIQKDKVENGEFAFDYPFQMYEELTESGHAETLEQLYEAYNDNMSVCHEEGKMNICRNNPDKSDLLEIILGSVIGETLNQARADIERMPNLEGAFTDIFRHESSSEIIKSIKSRNLTEDEYILLFATIASLLDTLYDEDVRDGKKDHYEVTLDEQFDNLKAIYEARSYSKLIESGQKAGVCGPIHAMLRELAHSFGFDYAHVLTANAGGVPHAIFGTKTSKGWVFINYGQITVAPVDDYRLALDLYTIHNHDGVKVMNYVYIGNGEFIPLQSYSDQVAAEALGVQNAETEVSAMQNRGIIKPRIALGREESLTHAEFGVNSTGNLDFRFFEDGENFDFGFSADSNSFEASVDYWSDLGIFADLDYSHNDTFVWTGSTVALATGYRSEEHHEASFLMAYMNPVLHKIQNVRMVDSILFNDIIGSSKEYDLESHNFMIGGRYKGLIDFELLKTEREILQLQLAFMAQIVGLMPISAGHTNDLASSPVDGSSILSESDFVSGMSSTGFDLRLMYDRMGLGRFYLSWKGDAIYNFEDSQTYDIETFSAYEKYGLELGAFFPFSDGMTWGISAEAYGNNDHWYRLSLMTYLYGLRLIDQLTLDSSIELTSMHVDSDVSAFIPDQSGVGGDVRLVWDEIIFGGFQGFSDFGGEVGGARFFTGVNY